MSDGLAYGVPEVNFIILFGLTKVLLLEQDLFDVVAFEPFLSDFLIVRNEILVGLVAQIFNILEDEGLLFVVD